MQLTQFTDFSLRTLIYCGAWPDRLVTISEVATAYGISRNHLMKVTRRLAICGYLEAIRGKNGGLRLARAPDLINIGEVVRKMEERFDVVECLGEDRGKCPLLPRCKLKAILHQAARLFVSSLDQYTLADLLIIGLPTLLAADHGRRRVRLQTD